MRWTQNQFDVWLVEHYPDISRDLATEEEADPGRESVLQRKIEAWCREWGRPYLSFHQSPKVKRILPPGWPDMEILMPNGKTLRIELKSAKGRLSDEQKRLRLQFLALGHTIHQIRSYKRFLVVISEYKS